MMLLITGRSASGKDRLKDELRDMFGLRPVVSRTTRPRRPGESDTHLFVTLDEEQATAERGTAVAWTDIGDHSYFAKPEDLVEADMYVIDPEGVYDLCRRMPSETFVVVNVRADEKRRFSHAVSRAEGDKSEADVFRKRSDDEAERFDLFEAQLDLHVQGEDNELPENVAAVIIVRNDFVPSTLASAACSIQSELIAYDNVRLMLDMCVEAGHIRTDQNGDVPLRTTEGEVRYLRRDLVAAEIMNDVVALGGLAYRWIRMDRIADNMMTGDVAADEEEYAEEPVPEDENGAR